MSDRFDSIESRIDTLTTLVEQGVDGINNRLDRLSGKVDRHEIAFAEQRAMNLPQLRADVEDLKTNQRVVKRLTTLVASLITFLAGIFWPR